MCVRLSHNVEPAKQGDHNTMTNTKSDSDQRRKGHVRRHDGRQARRVISIEAFGQRKGTVKALQKYRERRERKQVETAKVLRSYQKAMRREGYEPGTGASRNRKHERNPLEKPALAPGGNAQREMLAKSSTDPQQELSTQENTQSSTSMKNSSSFHRKRQKADPFKKSLKRAEQKKAAQQEREKDKDVQVKERIKKLKKRRQRTKLLTQRTSKGQPVMKNIVQDILQKLQDEQQCS